MRFAVLSSSGQVLAYGSLCILEDDEGDWILAFRTERGKLIEGGKITADGDLSQASEVLYRRFFQTWGISGVTLTSKI